MLNHPDILDTVGHDLDEVRSKIEATRAALQAVLDAQESVPVREVVARLDGMAAKLERIEETIGGRAVAAG
jgi:hypothetical protein